MRHPRLTFALFVAAALLLPDRAEAIPAFARKYQMSCTTCHAPLPRLKPFGEEFAARGFRMDDPSKEPARETLDVGDSLLRLPRSFPVAARLEGYAAWREDAVAEVDAEWPWAAKVLSGGPMIARRSAVRLTAATAPLQRCCRSSAERQCRARGRSQSRSS